MKSTKLALCFALLLVAASGCSFDWTRPGMSVDPLSGTWRGEWGPTPSRQTDVAVEFKWDGKDLTGTVDPEGNAYKFTKASFDPTTSVVKMELDGPNSHRETVHYLIEGKVSGKTISGTFDRAGEKGTFKIEKR
jgi:hypothetical protein